MPRVKALVVASLGLASVGCLGVACDKERVLTRCVSVDGAVEAVLVEPKGQWQDQLVVVKLNDAKSGKAMYTSETIGFAAGTVDGLAWSPTGQLVITSGPEFHPRILYDVKARKVTDQIEYLAKPPPAPPWAKTCRETPAPPAAAAQSGSGARK